MELWQGSELGEEPAASLAAGGATRVPRGCPGQGACDFLPVFIQFLSIKTFYLAFEEISEKTTKRYIVFSGFFVYCVVVLFVCLSHSFE